MTIPTNWNFPLHTERILSLEHSEQEKYWREFIFSIQRMYEQIAQGVNGDIQGSVFSMPQEWIPTLQGSTTADDFTYTHQVGWSFRQGLFVDIWFDIAWTSAGSAAGNLFLELPYIVSLSEEKPFVGVIQPSDLTFTGGTEIVINAIPDTFRGEFWNTGDAFTTANQSVVGSGQLIGHIKYLSKADE